MGKKNNFNFKPIVADIDKVRQMKAAKAKLPSKSIRPLVFEQDPEDSPLKAEIVNRINSRNLTYSDIYEYCTAIKGGDISEGQKLGYNVISGLKNRHTMIDTTFSMLADFLKLDIWLVDRKDTSEVADAEDMDEQ